MQTRSSFEKELRDIFLDQFINQANELQECVELLQNTERYEDAVNRLFRIFHGLKANSGYFHYHDLRAISVKVEAVLNALRDIQPPVSMGIVEWFGEICSQYMIWVDEVQNRKEFSSLKDTLLDAIEISDIEKSNPLETLKKYKVYYFHQRASVSPKLISVLQQYTAGVIHIHTMDEFKKFMQSGEVDFCIVDVDQGCDEAAKIFHKYSTTAALIVLLDKVDTATKMKLKVQGVYHTMNYPIRLSELQRELITVAESHFSSRKIYLDNKSIEKFIFGLQAFPEAIKRIQNVCKDSESSIKDLVKEVKQDPVISGIVLKEVQNPLYNLKDINTIDKAVTLLGKRYVYAIAMKKVLENFDLEDLDVYGIPFSVFSDVATKRYMLMIKWYAKISIASLDILATAAMLGNIGQLLIAKEIKRLGKTKEFQEIMQTYSLEYAEQKIMFTSTPRVSSDIFRYWNLNRDIIDSVRFSDNPQNAPMEIYDLALANYVVFRLIPLNGEVLREIPERVKELLLDQGMNIETLQNALDSVMELTQ